MIYMGTMAGVKAVSGGGSEGDCGDDVEGGEGGEGVANFGRPGGGNNIGRGVKAVSGAGSEGDGGDDVECVWAKRRGRWGWTKGGGLGTHWKPLNTSKRLENPNQGRPGGDNGRGVKAVSGGGRNGGDSVKWVGKALRAVGVEEVWAHIGVRMRGMTGAV